MAITSLRFSLQQTKKAMTKTTNIQQDTQNIPIGYKKTPLGIIPKEWEIKRLGDISTQLGNFSFSRAQLTDETQRLRYIHYGDIHVMSERDNVDLRKDKLPFLLDGLIDNTKIENQNFPLLQDGDVIFADASEDYEGIGNCWEVLNTNGYEIISGLHTIAIRFDKKFVSVGFGRHVFKNRKSSTALRIIAHGTKVYSLSYKNMAKLKIAIPPLPEQQKIAEILSTWDMAIEKQNALIEQLELRKRGLMQQLLTGKLRLRNAEGERFDETITHKKLKPFLTEISVRNSKNQVTNVLSVTNSNGFISQKEQFDRVVASADLSNYKIVRKGQFAYNPSRVNVGSLDLLRNFDEGVLSPMYIVFETKKEQLNNVFLYYHLKSDNFTKRIPMFVQGSVRDSLSFDGLCSMKFFIPSLSEQTAIAEVLSTADREIEIEKQKLSALQNQKKGLMQVLLTGKVRVKVSEQ